MNIKSARNADGSYTIQTFHPIYAIIRSKRTNNKFLWYIFVHKNERILKYNERFFNKGSALRTASLILRTLINENEERTERSNDTKNLVDMNMTRQEALQVLGLNGDASSNDIKKAHRNLISKIHPDVGGSEFLAKMINRAKEELISN